MVAMCRNCFFTLMLLVFLTAFSPSSIFAETSSLYPAYYEQGGPILWGEGVSTNGVRLWGYVDRAGRFVISPQYDAAGDFGTSGLAEVITTSGSSIWIDRQGHETTALPPSSSQVPASEYGLVPYLEPVPEASDSALYGYRSTTDGGIRVPARYAHADDFQDGYAVVSITGKGGTVLHGAVDAAGTIQIPCIYNALANYGHGRFIGEVYPQSGGIIHYLLNSSGKVLATIPMDYIAWQDEQWFCAVDQVGTVRLYRWNGNAHPGNDLLGTGRKAEVLEDGVVRFDNGVFLTYLDTDGSILWRGTERQIWPDGLEVHLEMRNPSKTAFTAVPVLSGYTDQKLQNKLNEKITGFYSNTAVSKHLGAAGESGYMETATASAQRLGGLGVFTCNVITGLDRYYEQVRWRSTLLMNLRTGQTYGLKDLLVKDTKANNRLADIASTTKAAFSIPGAVLAGFGIDPKKPTPEECRFDIREADGFTLTPESIVFYKLFYGVSMHYLPDFGTITVPFNMMDSLIDKKGELWQAMKAGTTKGLGREPLLPAAVLDKEGNQLNGYKNRMDQWVIPPTNWYGGFLGKADYAAVWGVRQQAGIIDRSGTVHPAFAFHQIFILGDLAIGDSQGQNKTLFDIPTGKVLASEPFYYPPDSRGGLLAIFKTLPSGSVRFGFTDRKGTIVIRPVYQDFRQSPDGRNLVVQLSNGKFIRIDQKGKLLNRYQMKVDLNGGYTGESLVYIDARGKRGIMNANGKILIPARYDELFTASKNRYLGQFKDPITGIRHAELLTETGKSITGNLYSEITYLDQGAYLAKTSASTCHLLNADGKRMRQLPQEGLSRGMDTFKSGLAACRSGDHFLILKPDGSIAGRFAPPNVNVGQLDMASLFIENIDGVLIWHGSEAYTPVGGMPDGVYLRQVMSYASEDGMLYPVQDYSAGSK